MVKEGLLDLCSYSYLNDIRASDLHYQVVTTSLGVLGDKEVGFDS